MGRRVNTTSVRDRVPTTFTGLTDFNCGTSFTTTETLVDITGSGVVDLLAFYNTKDVGAGGGTVLVTNLDIDGVRVCSISSSMVSGDVGIIGRWIDDATGAYVFQEVPFKSSFKAMVRSIGAETSLSMRGKISYRIV